MQMYFLLITHITSIFIINILIVETVLIYKQHIKGLATDALFLFNIFLQKQSLQTLNYSTHLGELSHIIYYLTLIRQY